MASDDSYMAFLNKANEDPSLGYPRDRPDPATQKVGSNTFKTRDEGVSLPSPIAKLLEKGDEFYVSDADEPFEGVALKFGEEMLPDEGKFLSFSSVVCLMVGGTQGGGKISFRFLLGRRGKRGGRAATGTGAERMSRKTRKTGANSFWKTETFASLINHPSPADADIEILDPVDWDRNGQYTDLIDAVTEASEGRDVKVYRVVKDSVRVEYWVVSVSVDGKLLVGVRALAVES